MSCKQYCARAIKLQTLTLEKFVESQFALRVRPWWINKQWKGNLVWYLRIIILRDAAFLTFLMHTVIFLLPSFFEQLIITQCQAYFTLLSGNRNTSNTRKSIFLKKNNLFSWFWDSNKLWICIIIKISINRWTTLILTFNNRI